MSQFFKYIALSLLVTLGGIFLNIPQVSAHHNQTHSSAETLPLDISVVEAQPMGSVVISQPTTPCVQLTIDLSSLNQSPNCGYLAVKPLTQTTEVSVVVTTSIISEEIAVSVNQPGQTISTDALQVPTAKVLPIFILTETYNSNIVKSIGVASVVLLILISLIAYLAATSYKLRLEVLQCYRC